MAIIKAKPRRLAEDRIGWVQVQRGERLLEEVTDSNTATILFSDGGRNDKITP